MSDEPFYRRLKRAPSTPAETCGEVEATMIAAYVIPAVSEHVSTTQRPVRVLEIQWPVRVLRHLSESTPPTDAILH
jgi:hypothetical protein